MLYFEGFAFERPKTRRLESKARKKEPIYVYSIDIEAKTQMEAI
jgi:hypothetical protein